MPLASGCIVVFATRNILKSINDNTLVSFDIQRW
jgi:hypothetical protein